MTTPIVQSITDEQLDELEKSSWADLENPEVDEESKAFSVSFVLTINRLRAAEKDAARWQLRAEVLRQLYNSMITNAELDAVIDAAVRLQP